MKDFHYAVFRLRFKGWEELPLLSDPTSLTGIMLCIDEVTRNPKIKEVVIEHGAGGNWFPFMRGNRNPKNQNVIRFKVDPDYPDETTKESHLAFEFQVNGTEDIEFSEQMISHFRKRALCYSSPGKTLTGQLAKERRKSMELSGFNRKFFDVNSLTAVFEVFRLIWNSGGEIEVENEVIAAIGNTGEASIPTQTFFGIVGLSTINGPEPPRSLDDDSVSKWLSENRGLGLNMTSGQVRTALEIISFRERQREKRHSDGDKRRRKKQARRMKRQ